MKSLDDLRFNSTRRHFLSATSLGIGGVALGALLDPLQALGGSPAAASQQAAQGGRCCWRRTSRRAPSG